MNRNRLLVITAAVLALSYLMWFTNAWASPEPETWHLDGPHSAAQFSVRHLGISTVRGAFTKVSGEVNYSASDPTKASVDVTIDASSVDTRVTMRDNDIRSEHFLDVAKYPTITFKSKRVAAAGPDKLTVTGDLTLHGVTKEVTLNVDGPSAPSEEPHGTRPAHGSVGSHQDQSRRLWDDLHDRRGWR